MACIAFGVVSGGSLQADDKLELLRSEDGQISVESPDVQLSGAVLNTAVDTRKGLRSLLGLEPTGSNHLYVRILPTEAGQEWPYPYLAAMLRANQLDFSLVLRVPDPRASEEFIRAVTLFCLYEKVLSNNKGFTVGQTLPQLPLWLNEGVMQVFLASTGPNWIRQWTERSDWPVVRPAASNRDLDRVITRAKSTGKAPTLDVVTGWKDLSSDSIERLWQQAFSYYLVASLTRPGSARESFQQWLTVADTNPDKAFAALPAQVNDEFAWRSQLERSTERSRDLVYRWEVSAEELDKAMSITLQGTDKIEPVTTTIDALAAHKQHPGLIDAVKDKVEQLTELQARSSALWQPTLTYYNAALLTLVNLRPAPKPAGPAPGRGSKDFGLDAIPPRATYPDLIVLARRLREEMQKQHELVGDYLNWVVVTKSAQSQGSAFASYYELQRKLENFRPGTAETMRSHVLKIENATSAAR